MNDIQAIAESLAPKMELAGRRQSTERKPGRGFVVQEPLKEENSVAFVSKKSMLKWNTPIMEESFEYPPAQEPVHVAAKVQLVQKPNEPVKRVVQARPVSKPNTSPAMVTRMNMAPAQTNAPNLLTLNKSISKVSNLIKDWLHIEDAFNQVKSDIKDKKMHAETFYIKLQNCIYHSLREFCGITKDEKNNDILPTIVPGMDRYSTLVFFDRIFNDRTVSYEKAPNKVMEKYRRVFTDANGIQIEWIVAFTAKVKSKMLLDDTGITKISNIIMKEWGDSKPAFATRAMSQLSKSNLSATPIGLGDEEMVHHLPVNQATANNIQTLLDATEAINKTEHDGCECHEHDDDEDLDEDDEDAYLQVSIFKDKDVDVVKFESSDGYGQISIPFYTNLDSIHQSESIPSIVDERNGKWDWLIHFAPDLMFKTQDPDKYLEANDDDDEDSKIKCVIMDENNGTYIIGVYCVASITVYDGDNEIEDYSDETIIMLNKLVNMEVASGYMSHLSRSLADPDYFRDEEYILTHVLAMEANGDIDDTDGNPEVNREELVNPSVSISLGDVTVHGFPNVDDDLATRAAIAAMNVGAHSDEEDDQVIEHAHEEDHQMDSSVVSIGGQRFNDDEDFTFQPIQRNKQRLQD